LTSRTLYLDCIGGIAGDMTLAALVDAGADAAKLRTLPEMLGIGPVEIDVIEVRRHDIRALHVDVRPSTQPPPRTWRAMREIVERAPLPEGARATALGALARSARAEAAVHGGPVEDVAFHELGGVDTLVDLCGAAVLLDDLGIRRVVSSPLPLARGLIGGAHGSLPLPAPATVELLRGATVVGVEGEGETVTPTGAAIATELAEGFGPPPSLTLESVGYGAGTRDTPERPNLLRVLAGTEVQPDAPTGEVVLLETNLDDLNPELVPDAVQRCFAAGALDVWTTPVQMKKGRPGIVLSVLARESAERSLAAAMFEGTTALGVRVQSLRRYELDREERVVEVGGDRVRVKLGRLDGRVINVAPEHDDCAAVAEHRGWSVKRVWAEALGRGMGL
jgi:pyridinium-3,5-bisthiocarboxylic acid mononucleotide nickel chelatase